MVLGANPPFAVFEGFVKRIWGHLGIERVVRMHMGLTIVKFNDEATRDFVLENGVVQFDRKPVIVRPWTQELDSIRLVHSVPLWIRLPDLGLQYWGKNCLSALVSTIGKPIMVDKFTKDRSMIKFARVLVEMDITDDPPFIIHFVNERGQLQEQFVEYEWLPIKCSTCKGYGHNAAECKKSDTKVWVSKNKLDPKLPSPVSGAEAATITLGETPESHEAAIGPKSTSMVTGTGEAAVQDKAQSTNLARSPANKENWEVPRKIGTSKSKSKTVSSQLDRDKNVFKVLQEQVTGEMSGVPFDSFADG
ncbi:uncharacterized protein LOC133785612 [Humulus lupulus]|uniref:uncharacterized protein LOC133785612 n=1 Tax=Humulus lupulus TaxID=3486 RepID=UPI002B40B934|nr:uncharacterized protein LOC133785612 [Humulus lupulus]